MPELPDIEAYIEALRCRVLGRRLVGVRLANPFLLRTVDPPLSVIAGARVEGIERLGKRIVFEVTPVVEQMPAPGGRSPGDARSTGGAAPSARAELLFLVLHLMVAGRLHWRVAGAKIPRGAGLAAFDFEEGSLLLTEAGKKRRASLHLLGGRDALAGLDPGGLEVLASTEMAFAAALRRENHTLKRVLTDPHVLSGIGNAYSDEILHRARLSPFRRSQALDDVEMGRLHAATVGVLREWTERLRGEAREDFPENVTAFREGMAVHGRFGSTCPVCGAVVQRIVYSENECDYCPGCQTEGRVLADRSLSRLLRDDWPGFANKGVRPPSADGSRESP